MDEVFGVLNNKQAAVNFKPIVKEVDQEQEGFESTKEYEEDLKFNNDPKLHMYEIVCHIKNLIENLLGKINSGYNFSDTLDKKATDDNHNEGRNKTNEAIEKRIGAGHDADFDDEPQELENVKKIYEEAGLTPEESEKKAQYIIENNYKIDFSEVDSPTHAFFDVTTNNGFALVQINKNHPFFEILIKSLNPSQMGSFDLALAA